eukprot:6193191-Pleurochrysis_carterae.AAC.2
MLPLSATPSRTAHIVWRDRYRSRAWSRVPSHTARDVVARRSAPDRDIVAILFSAFILLFSQRGVPPIGPKTRPDNDQASGSRDEQNFRHISVATPYCYPAPHTLRTEACSHSYFEVIKIKPQHCFDFQ